MAKSEPKKFVVINEQGVLLEGDLKVVHAQGEVLELDPKNKQVKELLANGSIGPYKTREEMVAEYGEEEVARLEEEAKESQKKDEVIDEVSTTDVAPAPAEEKEKEEEVPDEVVEEEAPAEAPMAAVSPTLMYRGKRIISIDARQVGERTLQQIRLESGETLDLTEEEYDAEVTTA